ncbi:MAG: hypothetical protein ACXU7D_00880 [Burkholderiaceae bacterium]
MEAFGIAIGILCGLVAAPVFCFLLIKFIAPLPRLSHFVFCVAVVSLAIFSVELLFVGARSAVAARQLVGPVFFPVHALFTLGSAPALACALLLGPRNIARWWPAAAAICWLVGVFAIFYQCGVSEALYGIDGLGGPYSGL